ncbi:MAG: SPOR domain-containing protein [Treponema sp.]|nr:SPOR domain-containing protein [Treponema sp.]
MKRVLLVLLIGLLFSSVIMAQAGVVNFSQRGAASQEMEAAGLAAAHPSLPIGSTVTVTNAENGRSVEATVIERIDASSERIVDLSFDVLSALDMMSGENVILSTSTPPRPRPIALAPPEEEPVIEEPFVEEPVVEVAIIPYEEPQPEPAPPPVIIEPEPQPTVVVIEEPAPQPTVVVREEPKPQPVIPEQSNTQPLNITVNTYIWTPETEARVGTAPNFITESHVQVGPPNEANLNRYQPPPVLTDELQIIPGLPDRNNGRIYRLQVGAFSVPESAARAAALVRDAGFIANQEISGAFYRVLAVGIRSADVYAASQRLGAMGFRQIWVRE